MERHDSELLDRVPPHNAEAERGVIGSLLLDPRRCDEVASAIKPADFYAPANETLYGHILGLYGDGGRLDTTLLLERLNAAGDLERVGGAEYMADVIHSVPHAGNATYYAKIVRDKAVLRTLIHAGTEIICSAYEPDGDPRRILDRAESELLGVELNSGDGEPVHIADAALQASLRIDEIQQRGESAGLLTGLSSFDLDQGGLFPGELIILAARPGIGKTSLANQIVEYNSRRGRLVYFASLEMSASELSLRLACGESGVSNRLVRTGRLSDGNMAALAKALDQQSEMHLDVHDRASMTIAAIRREIRKRKKDDIALAVVDYLQLVTPEDRKLPREQQVARMVRQLKETACEYEIPILCLCQLNRQAEPDEVPRLSHLRESGAIEQDADVVLFLARHKPTDAEPHTAVLMVAKNRNGETGPLRLDWDGPTTRFSCPESRGYEEFAEFA